MKETGSTNRAKGFSANRALVCSMFSLHSPGRPGFRQRAVLTAGNLHMSTNLVQKPGPGGTSLQSAPCLDSGCLRIESVCVCYAVPAKSLFSTQYRNTTVNSIITCRYVWVLALFEQMLRFEKSVLVWARHKPGLNVDVYRYLLTSKTMCNANNLVIPCVTEEAHVSVQPFPGQ